MSEDTSGRRPTRRNRATAPLARGTLGAPTAGQSIRHTPLTPGELDYILTAARAQRAREDAATRRTAA